MVYFEFIVGTPTMWCMIGAHDGKQWTPTEFIGEMFFDLFRSISHFMCENGKIWNERCRKSWIWNQRVSERNKLKFSVGERASTRSFIAVISTWSFWMCTGCCSNVYIITCLNKINWNFFFCFFFWFFSVVIHLKQRKKCKPFYSVLLMLFVCSLLI